MSEDNNGQYCECGEEAILHVTDEKIPLCFEHFDAWLKKIQDARRIP